MSIKLNRSAYLAGKVLLILLDERRCSTTHLLKQLQLTKSSAHRLVCSLEESGLIEISEALESERHANDGGRPPKMVELSEEVYKLWEQSFGRSLPPLRCPLAFGQRTKKA